jgi:hypothetical protein
MFIYTKPFLKIPMLQALEGGEEFVLLEPFVWINTNGDRVIVPPSGLGDFDSIVQFPVWTTDEGSIPKLFQNIFEKAGPNTPSFIVHDWQYASENKTREECDNDLMNCLFETEDVSAKRHLIYDGVRLGGGVVWDEHDPVNVTLLKAYQKTFLSEVPNRWPMLLK